MLTCVLSCSELAFLQKLVTYVEKKGGIQKLLRRLYCEKNLLFQILTGNGHQIMISTRLAN